MVQSPQMYKCGEELDWASGGDPCSLSVDMIASQSLYYPRPRV